MSLKCTGGNGFETKGKYLCLPMAAGNFSATSDFSYETCGLGPRSRSRRQRAANDFLLWESSMSSDRVCRHGNCPFWQHTHQAQNYRAILWCLAHQLKPCGIVQPRQNLSWRHTGMWTDDLKFSVVSLLEILYSTTKQGGRLSGPASGSQAKGCSLENINSSSRGLIIEIWSQDWIQNLI